MLHCSDRHCSYRLLDCKNALHDDVYSNCHFHLITDDSVCNLAEFHRLYMDSVWFVVRSFSSLVAAASYRFVVHFILKLWGVGGRSYIFLVPRYGEKLTSVIRCCKESNGE
jgi:hypothetical protein